MIEYHETDQAMRCPYCFAVLFENENGKRRWSEFYKDI